MTTKEVFFNDISLQDIEKHVFSQIYFPLLAVNNVYIGKAGVGRSVCLLPILHLLIFGGVCLRNWLSHRLDSQIYTPI